MLQSIPQPTFDFSATASRFSSKAPLFGQDTPSDIPQDIPQIDLPDPGQDQLSLTETQQNTPSRKKRKSFPLLGCILGCFGMLFGGTFCAIGVTAVNQFQQAATLLQQENPDAVASVSMNIPLLGNAGTLDITADRQVKAGGLVFGYFTPEGEAFTADGRRIGHADENGNLYSVLIPGQPLGRYSNGSADQTYGLRVNNILTINDPENQFTPIEEAAAALILMAHPDNMDR